MFSSPDSRLILRVAFAALLAGLASLKAAIPDGISGEEVVDILTSVALAVGAWVGVGALTPLEPFFGRQKRVEVPADRVELTDG